MSHVKFVVAVLLFSSSAFAAQTAYDSGDPSAQEQYALELINRARANPTAEGTRLGININEGLDAGLSAIVRPPLAMNKILLGTARAHSVDMYTNSYFAHDSKDGKSPFDRMTDAGYSKPGLAFLGENIAAASNLEAGGLEDILMVDDNYPHRGHRVNLLNIGGVDVFREIGVGYSGNSKPNKQNLNNYLTEDFGNNANGPFLLGVVYNDKNKNNFYDIGEGISGVTVTPDSGNFMAVTGVAGAYVIPVAVAGTLNVTISGGGLAAPVTLQATLGPDNVKLDFKVDAGGNNPPPAEAPHITSALTANGSVGSQFSYTITATGTAPVTLNADPLPNGLTFSGDKITGSPVAAGQYQVTLTATNASGTDTQTLVITVGAAGGGNPPPVGSSTKDTDGDGFPDELEKALSTSPTDAASTPLNIKTAPQSLSMSKMQIKLNFAKAGSDSITLSGLLPIPDGFDPANTTIVFDIGGVTRSFTLDAKRQAKSDNGESVKVGVKLTKKQILAQSAKLSAKFKGDIAASLADEGLVNATTDGSVNVPIYVIFNNALNKGAMTLGYKAKQDKSGSAH